MLSGIAANIDPVPFGIKAKSVLVAADTAVRESTGIVALGAAVFCASVK